MKPLVHAAFAALLLAAPLAFAQTEEDAGDVSEVDKDRVSPLRERIGPVSGHLFRKKGRLEVSPSMTSSINDPFFQKYLAGAAVSYYLTEHLGLNARVGFDLPQLMGGGMVSRAAQICTTEATGTNTVRGCRPPTYEELDGRAPGQLTMMAGLDVEYAPIYGKVGIVAETFVHFDLYGMVGAAMVGYRGPAVEGTGATSYTTVGGNVGIGARLVFTRWLALRAELRDLIYDERALTESDHSLRNQLLFELGVSVFLPSTFSPE